MHFIYYDISHYVILFEIRDAAIFLAANKGRDMQIEPNRLTELRQGKGLSRAQLAMESHISQRQITRIEGNAADAATKVRQRTVTELARALGVEPDVLTGDLPMPDAGSHARSSRGVSRQVSARLRPEASLACTLVERRYGVSRTTLFNAAPLMFVLLAEGSFVWRREELEKAEDAAEHLSNVRLGNRTFASAAGEAWNGASYERDSINKRDLFGEELFERTDIEERVEAGVRTIYDNSVDLGYDPTTNNPFADYLRHLAAQIGDPDIVEIDQAKGIVRFGPLENFPESTVCGADFAKFTGGSGRLNLAALLGYLYLDRIPEELLADDASNKRIAWLDERLDEQLRELSEEQRKNFEEWLSFWVDYPVSEGEEAGQ
ncbi:MAG: helix-turn-helix transcriptional regulator [Rhodospirillaceae bacterium]|nr:helix-turn-helix transcriptional regulator [Rhodospirillaceae bacterium]